MGKIRLVMKNVRVIVLVVFLLLALLAINPQPGAEGVAIRNIIKDSAAFNAGMISPEPTISPRGREVITAINGKSVTNIVDFNTLTEGIQLNQTLQIRTTQGVYRLVTQESILEIELNQTETRQVEEVILVNETRDGEVQEVNKTVTKTVTTPKIKRVSQGVEELGIKVYPVPENNIRKGLDLEGGTRVLLEPEEKLSEEDIEIVLANMKERLNVYGLSDVVVRKTRDLEGGQFILVEIAGANEEEVKDLLARQGKFEAKIGNETAFRGGQDVAYVCRSADCSGIDPQVGCGPAEGGMACQFAFSISLSPDAAKQQADITRKLDVVSSPSGNYLSQQLDLYLDNQLVDSLNIGEDLKGRAVVDIQISGSGSGENRDLATLDSLQQMKKLQTILITGSLPVKLNIVKTDAVSPVLGKAFINNALFIGIIAILSVALVIFIRYRILSVVLPVVITMASEIILMLGFAALVGWNIDLAAIAGIIIAAGTGVDDQIVIVDEVRRGEGIDQSWKQRIKNAFFIIFGAYFTTIVAMVPLLFAGAGLIKGFAFTTIVGVTFGVLVTRPAFAAMVEILLRK
jgi:preprotein translocase subunit SecD